MFFVIQFLFNVEVSSEMQVQQVLIKISIANVTARLALKSGSHIIDIDETIPRY